GSTSSWTSCTPGWILVSASADSTAVTAIGVTQEGLAARRRVLRHTPAAIAGAAMLTLVCAVALTAPWLARHDPLQQALDLRLRPPAWVTGGTWANPLGADHLGRDILSRLMYGARISLLVGLAAVVISGVVGVALGLVAGYHGGRLDTVIMRAVDIQL